MTNFTASYLGKLRAKVGNRLLLVPGARVVILDASARVLLQLRSDFGLWGLPGGNAEEGDDLQMTVRREAIEELGLEINSLKPFGFASDPKFETVRFPNGDVCQFFVMMFYTEDFMGQPTIGDDESLAVSWFHPTRLPQMLPNMRRSIEAFLEFQKTGQFQMI